MNNSKIRVACVIGTRPEVIKMAPIINLLKQQNWAEPYIISTAQHRELIDDVLQLFKISPDIDMNIMQQNQSIATLTGNMYLKMEEVFTKNKFDCVLAQGDTTTTFVASQISFFHRIPFGHVEAGLRTHDIYHPFPEELNRVYVSKVATWHFAPTDRERKNLLDEGIADKDIIVTGNTVIDSLYSLSKSNTPSPVKLPTDKRIILVTLHRRESFGDGVKDIFAALKKLADKFEDIQIIFPVHPNPSVKDIAHNMLSHHPRITLAEPLRYDTFVEILNKAFLVMSDSGGIQEEAPALDKPILILRNVTERPLVTELGLGILVGSNTENIVNIASDLLTDPKKYHSMQKNISPYGDGHAAERIIDIIHTRLNKVISDRP